MKPNLVVSVWPIAVVLLAGCSTFAPPDGRDSGATDIRSDSGATTEPADDSAATTPTDDSGSTTADDSGDTDSRDTGDTHRGDTSPGHTGDTSPSDSGAPDPGDTGDGSGETTDTSGPETGTTPPSSDTGAVPVDVDTAGVDTGMPGADTGSSPSADTAPTRADTGRTAPDTGAVSPVDSGETTADTGETSPVDTGDTSPGTDGTPPADTGDTSPDTGESPATETGDPSPDTGGTSPTDTGETSATDTGETSLDTGTPSPVDTGETSSVDSGETSPTDTGASTPGPDSGAACGAEVCDGVDDDCDGEVDEDAVDAVAWYADADGDTYGDATVSVTACDAPTGFVADATDCDDTLDTVHPGATETCGDGVDANCEAGDCGPSGGKEAGTDAWVVIEGSSNGDEVGTAVAAGDWDGDGDDDLAVGHRYDSPVRDIGRVHVWYGPLDGTETIATDDATLDAQDLAGDFAYGQVLTRVSDTDGDGDDELLVSTQSADMSASDDGGAWLFAGVTGDLHPVDAATIFRGAARNDAFGVAAADVGDQDGDGYDDVAIGATSYDGGTSAGGGVGIWYTDTLGASEVLSGADVIVEGTALLANFGGAVAGGDLDGDGTADVVVGAGATGPTQSSAVYVFWGPLAAGTVRDVDADVALTSHATGEVLGTTVVVLGDTTGDGSGDLAVGASGVDGAVTDGGAVYVWTAAPTSGEASATCDASVIGDLTGGALGTRLAAPGDVDGDGAPDLLAGAPRYDYGTAEEGAVFLFLAPLQAGTASPSAADAWWWGDTASDMDTLPTAIGGGDLDTDGYADILMSSMDWAQGAGYANYGVAYVVSGGPSD